MFEENIVPEKTWQDIFFPSSGGLDYGSVLRGGSVLNSSGRMVGQIIEGTFLSKAKNGLILVSGSSALFREGGILNFTSVPAPTACTATLVTTGTGNIGNGTHSYKITYVNYFNETRSGETELGTISNIVTVDDSHKQVNLSNIPISSSLGVIERKIYRTKAGGTDYYLLAYLYDNITITYTDNTADAGLGSYVANYMENDTFGKISIDGRESLSLGALNTYVGRLSGLSSGTAAYNVSVGVWSFYHVTSGSWNTGVGAYTGVNTTTGVDNTFIGGDSGYTNVTGSRNTFVGSLSGYYNNTDGGVYLGFNAGSYETAANKLFIDNQARTNEATARTNSLIYGVFAATPANQILTINGVLKTRSIQGTIDGMTISNSKNLTISVGENLTLSTGSTKKLFITCPDIEPTTSGKPNLGTSTKRFGEANFNGYVTFWYNIRPNTDSSYSSIGTSDRYFQYLYSYYVRYKDLAAFEEHDDIALIKNIKEKKILRYQVKGFDKSKKPIKENETIKVWDEKTMPPEVYKDGFYDAGAVNGLAIGTLKQLITKMENLEQEIKLLKNK